MKKTLKKIILALFAIILCLGAVSCGDKDDYVPAGYKRASNKNAAYNLYVPEGWIVDNSTGVTMARVSKTDSSNISLMVFDFDESKLNSVTSDGNGEEKSTLDKFWEYYSADFLKTFPDMTYDKDTNGKTLLVSKKAAQKYIYTATVTGAKYKFMQVVVIKDKTVYIFTYTAKEELFNDHLSEAEKIVSYFEFK